VGSRREVVYHCVAGDPADLERFRTAFTKAPVSDSLRASAALVSSKLGPDEIRHRVRESLGPAEVAVVLLRDDTWRRRHVDWEIAAALSPPRAGLVGIYLPRVESDPSACPLPPRLGDNLRFGYASVHPWSDDPVELKHWLQQAIIRSWSPSIPHDNSRPLLGEDLAA